MHHAISILVIALVATFALAAPTPSKALAKTHFRVPVTGRKHRSGLEELAHVYHKHGWTIIVWDPKNPFGGIYGYPSQSAAPYGLPSSSVAAPFGFPSSSAAPFGFPSASAAPYPSSFPSGVPSGSPSGFPSGIPSGVPSGFPTGTVGSPGPSFSSRPYPNATSSSIAAPSSTVPASSMVASGSSAAASTTASSTGSSETGEVSATPYGGDSLYISPVSIGGQTLNLDFDTGSADLWVFSTTTPSDESSGHTLFDPSKSSTWQDDSGASWNVSYGDGSTASGTVGFDTVNIGGATVKKQAVELATSVSGSFTSDTESDGLLGLGFSNINTIRPGPQKTFFDNVMDQLEQPVFTADLNKNSGEYEFGVIDHSKYTGTLHYTDIDSSRGYWQFTSDTYTIGGSQSQCQTCHPGIVDTGTSLILVDDDVVKAYYNQVNSASYDSAHKGYVFSCGTDLPDFGVAIGSGYTATVKGADLSYGEVRSGTCFGGIQTNQGNDVQIFGDVFLKDNFVVFDGSKPSLGIAPKA